MTVETIPVGAEEDRSLAALTEREVDCACGAGRERECRGLATLAQNGQRPVTPLETEGLDVGPGRFGDSQPVERERRDEGVLAGRSEPCRHEEGTDLVAVEPGGV